MVPMRGRDASVATGRACVGTADETEPKTEPTEAPCAGVVAIPTQAATEFDACARVWPPDALSELFHRPLSRNPPKTFVGSPHARLVSNSDARYGNRSRLDDSAPKRSARHTSWPSWPQSHLESIHEENPRHPLARRKSNGPENEEYTS